MNYEKSKRKREAKSQNKCSEHIFKTKPISIRQIIMDMDMNKPNDVPVREKNRIRNILTSSTK